MDLAFFKELGEKIEVSKGEYIVETCPEEPISFIYLLEEGIAALASVNEEGEKQTYQYFTEPAFLNIIPFLTRERLGFENNQIVNVQAKTTCQIYKISSHQFLEQLQTPEVSLFLLDSVLMDYIFTMEKQRSSHEGTGIENLCRFLLSYTHKKDGYLYLNKVFTYSEIASFLQVHEVSVARFMKELKDANIIQKKGHELMIADLSLLEHYANRKSEDEKNS